MEKVKAIHVITKMELGGAQQNTLYTVLHLNREKYLPFLVTGKGGELFEESQACKRTVIAPDLIREIRPLRDIKAFFQIVDILKTIKNSPPAGAPLLVHTHSSKAGIVGRWAAWFFGIPVIIHSIHGFGFHDYQPAWSKWLYIFLERLTARITTKFIAVSRANIAKGTAAGVFPPGSAVLIRSGIDLERFRKASRAGSPIRKQLGIPIDAPVVANVSCLKPQKAPLDFIRACRLVHQEVPDAHFLMVGDGALRNAVEKDITEKNLQDCVHLLGWRRDIPEIMQEIDVLVLTSLWEGLPRVIPQAMAAQVPVVATRVDGSPEAVGDGKNGFLVDPGDVELCARKVIFLLKNPERARAMGKLGSELVAEFDCNKMVLDQERLYGELLKARDVI